MQEALERALGELILGSEFDPEDRPTVDAWLTRHGVSDEDREFLLEQGIERLFIYRELVQYTLRDAVYCSVPRTIARLGPIFDEYLARFLAEVGPATHYLRDVPREFLGYAKPLFDADPRVPPFLSELAEHEALRIEIGAMRVAAAPSLSAEPALDRGLVFSETARLVHYRYRVHELPDDEDDRSTAELGPVSLLVYRSPAHEVRYLELSDAASALLDRLLNEKATLGAAIEQTCSTKGVAMDAALLEGTARLLADLAERGALLGVRP